MAVTKDAIYEEEYNCLTTDLVEGYPPVDANIPENSWMNVYNDTTKTFDSLFKKVFGAWYKY